MICPEISLLLGESLTGIFLLLGETPGFFNR